MFELDENLKNFLQNKFNHSLYGDFFNKKLLIINNQINKTTREKIIFCLENEKIFKYQDENFIIISENDFINTLKLFLENLKNELHLYEELIEHKENHILKGKSIHNILKKCFILRQKISKIALIASSSYESLNALINEETKLKKSLKILIFNALNISKNAKELNLRLESLYNLISSIKNEKMNKNIYILSIISTIVLPLNLIVGFFGMNTGGLFLSENENGTWFILILLSCICFFGLLYYQIKARTQSSFDEELQNAKAYKKLKKDSEIQGSKP